MAEISFEKALDELKQTVMDLEGGKLSLEKSIEKYEAGIALVKSCEKRLSEARQKVEILSKDGELKDFDQEVDE